MKQVLDQLYSLQDQHNALKASVQAASNNKNSGPPPGSGPTDTQVCGLFVEPIDANTLANGAALKYNKARGTFSFQ